LLELKVCAFAANIKRLTNEHIEIRIQNTGSH